MAKKKMANRLIYPVGESPKKRMTVQRFDQDELRLFENRRNKSSFSVLALSIKLKEMEEKILKLENEVAYWKGRAENK